jgi:abhydrolase domain-containing protein 11
MLGSKANFGSIIKHKKISSNISGAYLLDLRNHGESPHSDFMSNEELALDIKNFLFQHNLGSSN